MIAALYRSPPLLLSLTALMWASNAMFGQLVVGEITPYALVLARWVMVAAVMWALRGRDVIACWPEIRGQVWRVALMAATGFTAFNTLFYIASIHTTGLNVGIIQGAMPVFVMLGAFLAYRDRVSPMQALGAGVTLIGVAVVASGGSLAALAALAVNDGDLIMLVAAVFYSAYTVALRKRPEVPGATLFTVFAVVAAITAAPLAIWEAVQPGYAAPTPAGWVLAVLVAIFPSCLAQLFFLRGVDLIGPSRAGVYINLVPVLSSILAVIVLGEAFGWQHAVALPLVLGGIWIAQRKG